MQLDPVWRRPGYGGRKTWFRGDLCLHSWLVDDGLEVRLVVTPWEAHAGTRYTARTARGTVSVAIPPGSRSGLRLRLRNQGLADGKGGHGDCFVRLEMDLPTNLSPRQQELLRELAGTAAGGPS